MYAVNKHAKTCNIFRNFNWRIHVQIFILEQATKSQRGSSGIALPFI